MKAVVMQISNKTAAVLADDGCMHNVPNKNYQTGERIELAEKNSKLFIAGIAAAVAILCVGLTSAWATLTPYYYVSLDVNPSVEYSLNRFDRVLSVKGVNDDGSELLLDAELADIKGGSIQSAVNKTIKLIENKGYFPSGHQGGVIISASAKDIKKAEHLADNLRKEVEKQAAEANKEVKVEAIAVGRERVDEARELGITPGKLNLIEKLKEATGDNDMSYQEWLDKPVKDIMKAIKDSKLDLDDLLDDDDDIDDLDDNDDYKDNNGKKPDKKDDNDDIDDIDDLYDDDDDRKENNGKKPDKKPTKDNNKDKDNGNNNRFDDDRDDDHDDNDRDDRKDDDND